ncbi:MAG: ribonuclease R [Candidatus Cloacimonetes bacterium]|nr:ribonuclease R [Candidatus Cloacimonadota bacterium]
MYDKKLENKILKLLEDNSPKRFRVKDIAHAIRLNKHLHKDLLDTLFQLVNKGKLNLHNRKYSAVKSGKTKIISGIFDATTLAKNKSYAFVKADPDDIFISSEDTLNAYHNDIVKLEIKYQRNGKKYGIITEIVKRVNEIIIGSLQQYNWKYYIVPDNSRIHTNFVVNGLNNAREGEKVVLKITNWGNRELFKLPAGDIVEILGKAGNPDVEVLGVLKQYNLPLEFPSEVITELQSINEEISEYEISRRKDLRDLLTFTIDPESAKDFDDAISLIEDDDGFKLFVHIADVSHYIKINSNLFKEAAERGNSYYFPKRVIPMLPEKISNKICSLRPAEDKLTVTVETSFSSDHKIKAQKVYNSIICSDARFNYEEIDDFFEGNIKFEAEMENTLKKMRILSASLKKARISHGYLQLNIPETVFIFDDEGHVTDLQRSQETDSHKMIENFMLAANEFIAGELSSGKSIYRIHEQPDEEMLIKLKDELAVYDVKMEMFPNKNTILQKLLAALPNDNFHRVFDRKILRSLKKAKYSVDNLGHFGLGMEHYTHFTSPIRRISDLVIHNLIKKKLAAASSPFSTADLFNLADNASKREMIADESEREVDMKNKMIFMKKHLGEEFTAIIIGIRNNIIIVELDRYPVTGIIEISSMKDDHYEYYPHLYRLIGKRKGKIYNLTDKLNLMLSKVDDDIYFQLIN